MIYSINEGFFDKGKPNKVIVADVKAAEELIKGFIKFFNDALNIITDMRNAICKDNVTDKDLKKVKDCMQKLNDMGPVSSDRKLINACVQLIKANCKKDVGDLEFAEGTPDDYKALVKKVSAYGQYTKQLDSIYAKYFKLNDDYAKMWNKRKELSTEHFKACEEFGGMVGYMIGSMPNIKPSDIGKLSHVANANK